MTNTQKNEKLLNKLFFNVNKKTYVHIKRNDMYNYGRNQIKFDVCEWDTKEGAIAKKDGKSIFTTELYRLVAKGIFIPVK